MKWDVPVVGQENKKTNSSFLHLLFYSGPQCIRWCPSILKRAINLPSPSIQMHLETLRRHTQKQCFIRLSLPHSHWHICSSSHTASSQWPACGSRTCQTHSHLRVLAITGFTPNSDVLLSPHLQILLKCHFLNDAYNPYLIYNYNPSTNPSYSLAFLIPQLNTVFDFFSIKHIILTYITSIIPYSLYTIVIIFI